MISRTFSSCIDGVKGKLVQLEASKQNALPQIQITGLPNEVVQESRERVKASLLQLGFSVPTQKLLVHLSPAGTKKGGSHFDLPIAMSILTLEGFFPTDPIQQIGFLGELSLSGKVRAIRQLIPLLEALLNAPSISFVLVPRENALEAALFESDKIVLCDDIREAIAFCFEKTIPRPFSSPPQIETVYSNSLTLDSIVGLKQAKRSLVISLAGRHPFLLEGPPGAGKTLLAHSCPSLLPPLSQRELLEVSRIHSLSGLERPAHLIPPFRAPHHSISSSAFLGGGSSQVTPGEISLAHNGILFMDELPEFRRDAIEGLREPLQEGEIRIHRISQCIQLPAKFHLIAAMNPCRCGYAGSKLGQCSCSPETLRSYRKRLSGPLLDRFPIYFWLEPAKAHTPCDGYSQTVARQLISKVRSAFDSPHMKPMEWLKLKGRLDLGGLNWLRQIESHYPVSFRRLKMLLEVGFTLALLEDREHITELDLEEAWSLRPPEILS
ncbi:MAG: ATP-binding protein [Proteobacteria bacterium]|nr:ATP-binding protein [Pseudomonadota bacterium]